MKRFLKLTKALMVMHIRNRVNLFWNLAFPVFLLVIYSLIFSDSKVGGVAYMTWVVPGVLVFNLLAYGLIGSGTLMVEMREKGILRRVQATPMPALYLILSYLCVNLVVAGLQAALIVGFGVVAFGMSITAVGILRAVPMVVAGALVSLALGQVLSGLSPSAGVAVAIGQIVNFSQMFVTDMVMPLQYMPTWLQRVAVYLPAHAIVRLVRPPLVEGRFGADLGLHLGVAGAYLLVSMALAAWRFRWSPRA